MARNGSRKRRSSGVRDAPHSSAADADAQGWTQAEVEEVIESAPLTSSKDNRQVCKQLLAIRRDLDSVRDASRDTREDAEHRQQEAAGTWA